MMNDLETAFQQFCEMQRIAGILVLVKPINDGQLQMGMVKTSVLNPVINGIIDNISGRVVEILNAPPEGISVQKTVIN